MLPQGTIPLQPRNAARYTIHMAVLVKAVAASIDIVAEVYRLPWQPWCSCHSCLH